VGSKIISFGTTERAFLSQNPGLKHAELRHEGFIAVKVTAEEHIAEYIHVGEGNLLSDYSSARAENDGKLTAGFFCSGKFTTQAGVPGSLAKESLCDAIESESDRPAEWSIPVPKRDSALALGSFAEDCCQTQEGRKYTRKCMRKVKNCMNRARNVEKCVRRKRKTYKSCCDVKGNSVC